MSWTVQELEILKQYENAAFLRDLHHTEGWRVYCLLAQEKIQQLTRDYLREDLSRDEIFEAHIRLKAITQFQGIMEENVREAVNLVDPMSIEQLIRSLHQPQEL
jgi:hypothetical protein